MQTLGLSLRTRGDEGQPLPSVFHQLDVLGAKPRMGQLTLIAAAPGGGKSAIATFLALMMRWSDGSNVPTLYFSADSDRMTFGMRAMAGTLNIVMDDAEEILLARDPDGMIALDEATRHMWVDFDASPSPRDLDDETEAFAYVYGSYPQLIVVDNLMDVNTGGMQERDAHDAVLDYCKRLARRTSAAVLVLCHVTGEYTDGKKVIPRSGLINKIDKRPRLILTLHQADTNLLGVSVVKNSNGRADSSGVGVLTYIPVMWEKSWFGRGE